MIVQEGKRYINRDGKITGTLVLRTKGLNEQYYLVDKDEYQFVDLDNRRTYRPNGTYSVCQSCFDLMSEFYYARKIDMKNVSEPELFSVQLTPQLHEQVVAVAAQNQLSTEDMVLHIIKEYLAPVQNLSIEETPAPSLFQRFIAWVEK